MTLSRTKPSSTYHFFFEVDKKFGIEVSNLSKKIFEKYHSKFIIGENYVPHFTLYLFSAPIRNTKQIIEEVRKISEKITHEITLTSDIMELSNDGWLMIGVKEKASLSRFHSEALNHINQLREGFLRKKYRQQSYVDSLPEAEKSSLLRYGDKHAMKLFHPHVSLAEFTDLDKAKIVFTRYKDFFLDHKVTLTSLELVREYNEGTGGIGKILFKKNLN